MSEAPKPPPPPPPPAPPNPQGGGASSGGGLDNNIAGLLAYFVIPAVIWLVLEPYSKNKFIRFHAFQGLALCVASIVLNSLLAVTIIGLFLTPFLSLAIFAVAIVCMIKAFQDEMWELPVIGKFAREQAEKI